MGESLVEAPKVENKMGETVTGVPCFEQSVSFGRFEHDSLCWERWSTFPTNKYLEEVEKCSTPGSVAQKKAYFEAHYKKIAAKKAELLQDQENKREAGLVGLEDQTPIDSGNNVSKEGLDNGPATPEFVDETDQLENEEHGLMSEVSVSHFIVESDGANIINQNEAMNLSGDVSKVTNEMNYGTYAVNESNEVEVVDLASDVRDHIDEVNDCAHVVDEIVKTEVVAPIGELNGGADNIDEIVKSEGTEHVYEPLDIADIIKESYDVLPEVEHSREDLCLKTKTSLSENVKESVLVTEDLSLVQGFQDKVVFPQRKVEGKICEKETKSPVELISPNKPKKVPFVKKTNIETNAKKKPASPVPKRPVVPVAKSPMLSPKSLNPELTKPAKAAATPSIKKEIGSSTLSSKRTTRSDSKRVFPTSLHMSLSLEPGKSDAASLSTTRKSLFMESMGDKEIVKRAFKAFQNITSPPARHQSASEKVERKSFTSENLRKKTERIGHTLNPSSTPTGQQRTKKTLLSPGLKKNVGVEVRTATSVAASFGPRVQLQGKKPKEVTKKLECNTKTNDKETTYLQSKVTAEKPAQVRRPSQTINSKPKLSSSYNQGRGFFNGSVQKENTKAQASG